MKKRRKMVENNTPRDHTEYVEILKTVKKKVREDIRKHNLDLLHQVLDTLSYRFLPVFGTVDTGKGWHSQVCPRAIGGIDTCHKMRHSLSLPTVTYICMGELPHFHHGPTWSFLHSQPIQTPPSGPGLICAAGQVFIWDDPSVTPLS